MKTEQAMEQSKAEVVRFVADKSRSEQAAEQVRQKAQAKQST